MDLLFFFFFFTSKFHSTEKKKRKKVCDKNDCNPQTEVEHNACREVASVQLKYLGTVVDSKLNFMITLSTCTKEKRKRKIRAPLVLV